MRPPQHRPAEARQRGAALMVMLVIMVMGIVAVLARSVSNTASQIEHDRITADALVQAKEALLGYAAKVQVSNACASNCARPGDLPCPDINNDGSADTPCNTQSSRLGRLPWKTLGLPDLRDGSGERLWYAVSNNFKNNTRTPTLNSDTLGTITVRTSDGSILYDGGASSGVVAVIIAPGDVLQRTDQTSPQNRSSAGINTASSYLDIANGEDNASFTDTSTDGFIQGRIKNSNGNTILNDQLLVITQNDIMQVIQKRVAGEVKQCLIEYASINNGRYPWSVPLTDLINYNDSTNRLFGRIPDDLDNTDTDSGGGVIMDNKWGPMCNTHNNNTAATWWLNWREMVFYGLANPYRPINPPTTPATNTCATPGNCLSVNPVSTSAKFVVIVAGKMLPTQTLRYSNKANANFYLEGGNQNADQSGTYTFTQAPASAAFNDTVMFQ